MVRYGISSYTFPWHFGVEGYGYDIEKMTPEDLIQYAAKKEVPLVQLCDNAGLLEFEASRLNEIKKLADLNGIELQIGFTGITKKRVMDALEIAEILDAKIMRTLTDTEYDKPSISNVIDTLRSYTSILKKRGKILAIENHDRFTAEEYSTVLNEIGSPYVGLCFDTANSLGQLEDYTYCFDIMKEHVVNFHYKEYTIHRINTKMGFLVEGAKPGEGDLRMDRVIADIYSISESKCIDIILEQWPPYIQSIKETIKQESAWAEAGILAFQDRILNR